MGAPPPLKLITLYFVPTPFFNINLYVKTSYSIAIFFYVFNNIS